MGEFHDVNDISIKAFRKEITGANVHIQGIPGKTKTKIKSTGREQILKIKIKHDSSSIKRSETYILKGHIPY